MRVCTVTVVVTIAALICDPGAAYTRQQHRHSPSSAVGVCHANGHASRSCCSRRDGVCGASGHTGAWGEGRKRRRHAADDFSASWEGSGGRGTVDVAQRPAGAHAADQRPRPALDKRGGLLSGWRCAAMEADVLRHAIQLKMAKQCCTEFLK